jgi:hypothetical protein
MTQARTDAQSAAQQIIQAENDRIKAAQDATKETNNQLNEATISSPSRRRSCARSRSTSPAYGISTGGGAVSTAFGTSLK